MCCNAVQPVSAVSKSMREVVVVVATLYLQLCLMHQRPVQTGHQAHGVQAVMSSQVFASFH